MSDEREKCGQVNGFWSDLPPCGREKDHDGAHISYEDDGASVAWGNAEVWDALAAAVSDAGERG